MRQVAVTTMKTLRIMRDKIIRKNHQHIPKHEVFSSMEVSFCEKITPNIFLISHALKILIVRIQNYPSLSHTLIKN